MVIRGIEKTSLIDFPGAICTTVFTGGCNLRCPYCHNRDLVLGTKGLPSISEEEVLAFLAKRRGLVDGLCITGGEPTLDDGLKPFIHKVRELGFGVKLDTNGTNPHILKSLVADGLLDYIAMDIKAPQERYQEVTRSQVDVSLIEESVTVIRSAGVNYEFRTTVAPGLITEEDLLAIGRWLDGARKYVLQQFVPGMTLDPAFAERRPYTSSWFVGVASRLRPFFGTVEVRGC